MAVMYSKLVGCLGKIAKLGPLARTGLCTGVKGLLDRLMTHLGLGPSLEESMGLFALILLEGEVLPPWVLVLLTWEVALSPWEALSLAEHLLLLPELLPA